MMICIDFKLNPVFNQPIAAEERHLHRNLKSSTLFSYKRIII